MDKLSDEFPQITLTGDWTIEVTKGSFVVGGKHVHVPNRVTLSVSPLKLVEVEREYYKTFPLFDSKAPGWKRGVPLIGCRCQETSAKDALDVSSLEVYRDSEGPDDYEVGRDYDVDLEWATLGRLSNGRIQDLQALYVSYRYGQSRIDSVIVDQSGMVSLRLGIPHVCAPRPPDVKPHEKVLANIWLSGRLSRLTDENLFPIQQDVLADLKAPKWARARVCLPKTVQKLQNGEPLRILAW